MLSFFAKLTFLLILLLGGMLTLVHGQPTRDSDLRMLLTGDENCSAPCWMGIEIGSTHNADAKRLLEAHPWVGRVVETDTALIWRWNGQQPALINAAQDGLLKISGGIVRQARIQTNIPFGDVWLILSQPDDVLLVRPMSRYSAFQIASYTDVGIQVISTLSCPIDPAGFWSASTTLGIGEIWTTEALNGRSFDIYDEVGWWRNLRRCAVIGE